MSDNEQLAEMIANLSAHIDEKAAEVAKPRIEAAFTAACVGIADAEREAIFEKQRLDDLTAELRRQVECQVRRAERAEAERDNYLDRLRTTDGAYSRLDAQKRDLEGVRDRLRSRAEQAESAILRDKWLTWPEDDMHYAAGLMLARHLSGEAFTVDAPAERAVASTTSRSGTST